MVIANEKERCCSHPHIVNAPNGTFVCDNCGLIIDSDVFENTERRVYTNKEVNERKRSEPRWREFGPRTIIDKNDADDFKKKALYSRLSKINGSLISSLERNLWEAEPKMRSEISQLVLPKHIRETAWKIYREVAIEKLTMGRSISAFITASIYVAIRIHKHPMDFEWATEASPSDRRSIHKALAIIVQKILPKLGYKYIPMSALDLVYSFGQKLKIPMHVQREVYDMILQGKKRGLRTMGKDPKGLVAAAYYIVGKKRKDVSYTQNLLADEMRITEVTLRTRAKELRKAVGLF